MRRFQYKTIDNHIDITENSIRITKLLGTKNEIYAGFPLKEMLAKYETEKKAAADKKWDDYIRSNKSLVTGFDWNITH